MLKKLIIAEMEMLRIQTIKLNRESTRDLWGKKSVRKKSWFSYISQTEQDNWDRKWDGVKTRDKMCAEVKKDVKVHQL